MDKMENSKCIISTDWEMLGGLCFEIVHFIETLNEVELSENKALN